MRLADRLAAARRRRFVGRGAELARFGELLGGGDAPRVVLVHGPGGVGKTALLHQFAWRAEQAGRRCVWLDGREVPPDATVVLGLLDGDVAPGVVLLVDGAETLDRLLREEVLPRLTDDALTVLSCRERPPLAWRADPGWRELVEVMPLGNLGAADGRALLAERGVPAQEASPRDRRAFRALHHTYLRPAATQQAAADLLDLPMSTFRRHLAEGVSRLTELLWRQASAAGWTAQLPRWAVVGVTDAGGTDASVTYVSCHRQSPAQVRLLTGMAWTRVV